MMSPNMALVRCFLDEIVNGGDTRLIPELVAADHVRHAPDGDLYGPEGVRINLAEWRTGLPDLRVVIEDLFAGGDRVVSRFVLHGTYDGPFLGVPTTRQEVALVGIGIDRVAGDRLAESWIYLDVLGLLRHLSPANPPEVG
ncbi:MAG TPA: ester cyclase [Thermomicrobiales bacterium]|nr:ester cyclase [Thermomicrobiales bacterium]